MKRVGSAKLWLAEGMVPHFREMVALGREILRALVDAHGPAETVKRFSNPYWLSALSCVLGFEWDTSGQTTVTLRALKIALRDSEIPVRIIGGKGEEMRWVSYEASRELRRIGVENIDELTWASKFSCSVDDSALQDSYRIYFHSVIVDEERTWAVVNQGMNLEDRTARRYHWSCDRKISVEKPHASIFAEKDQDFVLDLTSLGSSTTRETMIEILGDSPPSRLKEDLAKAKMILRGQGLLDREIPLGLADRPPDHLAPPNNFDEETLRRAKGVRDFADLLTIRGMGAATIRGLAYISCLIYGSEASWRDPAKFAYAHGTKGGRPYPVDRHAMTENASLLRDAVLSSRLGEPEKIQAIRRLAALTSTKA